VAEGLRRTDAFAAWGCSVAEGLRRTDAFDAKACAVERCALGRDFSAQRRPSDSRPINDSRPVSVTGPETYAATTPVGEITKVAGGPFTP